MCGIAGIYNLDGAPVDRALLARMTRSLAHRGPDGEGLWIRGHVGLGHRRLSIIDLEGGAQPLENEDGQVVVTFNGEIFNYRALAGVLVQRGHRFRTRSDTEVLLHGYEERGAENLKTLRGMFAFGLYDANRDRLLLARDRLGIKNLYWASIGRSVVFASELRALLEHPSVDRRISESSVTEYLLTRFVRAPNTIVAGVSKVPPSSYIWVTREGTELHSYWELPNVLAPEDDSQDSLTSFRERFEDAVDAWMVSDVPVGAFLSGGLDSSTLVAAMCRRSNGRVKTFTATFAQSPGVDEAHHARRVAEHLGTEHHELRIEPGDPEELRRVFAHLEEPLGDPAVVPTYLLSRAASNHVKVVMSGEGSDELNLGYARYRQTMRVQALARLPGAATQLLGRLGRRIRLPYSVRQSLGLLQADAQCRWRSLSGLSPFRPEILTDRLAVTEGANAGSVPREETATLLSTLARGPEEWDLDEVQRGITRADLTGWLSSDLLVKVDKMTMAFGLEARTPFLDHHLVEGVFASPVKDRVSLWTTKRVLRRYAIDVLPRATAQRRQHGFIMPIEGVFPGLERFVDDVLSRHRASVRAWIRDTGDERVSGGMLRWMLFALFLVAEELRLDLPF